MKPRLHAGVVGALGVLVLGCHCTPRAILRACLPGECGAESNCVAGRCVNASKVLDIQDAERVILRAEDAVILYREPRGGVFAPTQDALGAASQPDARLFLRFRATLPEGARIVESFVILDRPAHAHLESVPVQLHAERATTGTHVSRLRHDALGLVDMGAARTTVNPARQARMRLPIQPIVDEWIRGKEAQLAIVVVADTVSPLGVPIVVEPSPGDENADVPRLELYVLPPKD